MQVKKQQFEPDMEEWTGSKSGKEYCRLYSILSSILYILQYIQYTVQYIQYIVDCTVYCIVYCHPAYLTYMETTSFANPVFVVTL